MFGKSLYICTQESNELTLRQENSRMTENRHFARVASANIRLFSPHCYKLTKSLSKIKVYGNRENDKRHPDEVPARRAEGVHFA